MQHFGGKDSKRHFTVVMGNKEHGLYVSSTPSSAARKAVTKLCSLNKSKKVEFSIREITQGSKKKTYGPYEGHIEKLKVPIELKGRVIKYKPVARLSKKTGAKKGGMKITDIIAENYRKFINYYFNTQYELREQWNKFKKEYDSKLLEPKIEKEEYQKTLEEFADKINRQMIERMEEFAQKNDNEVTKAFKTQILDKNIKLCSFIIHNYEGTQFNNNSYLFLKFDISITDREEIRRIIIDDYFKKLPE
jgi:hypothetical protein